MTPPAPGSDPQVLSDYYSAQYNARADIPDHPEIFAGWANRSAQVRSGPAAKNARLDVAYGENAGERLDFFPAPQLGGPLFVFIHGGWWRSLDKSDFSFIVPGFHERGINVALTNYTLAPAAAIEDITLQQVGALAWLYHQAPSLGANRERIIVSGHSAGGHLAAMLMAADWPAYSPELPIDLVKGGLVFSGLYDLEMVQHAAFVRDDLRLTPERVGQLSPARMTQSHPTPFTTAVGGLESDEFKRQNRLLRDAWSATHVADIALPEANHLTICDGLGTPGAPLFAAAIALLGQ